MKKLLVLLFVSVSLLSNAQMYEDRMPTKQTKQFEPFHIDMYPDIDIDSVRYYAYKYLNEYRASLDLGLNKLIPHEDLEISSMNHAIYCADKNQLTHRETDTTSEYYTGYDPGDRCGSDGECGRMGNVQLTDPKEIAKRAIEGWIASKRHEFIIKTNHRYVGFGVSRSPHIVYDETFDYYEGSTYYFVNFQ